MKEKRWEMQTKKSIHFFFKFSLSFIFKMDYWSQCGNNVFYLFAFSHGFEDPFSLTKSIEFCKNCWVMIFWRINILKLCINMTLYFTILMIYWLSIIFLDSNSSKYLMTNISILVHYEIIKWSQIKSSCIYLQNPTRKNQIKKVIKKIKNFLSLNEIKKYENSFFFSMFQLTLIT